MQNYAKYRLKILRGALAVALVAAVALAIAIPVVAIAAESEAQKPVIVVDAGHGGEDSGVRGTRTGARESDLNLQVARLLGECASAGGFKVVYTRTSDSMHSFDGVNNNKKRADMFKRGEIIAKAKPLAVVSIHMNFFSASSRRGAQTFFDANSKDGRELADILQDLLNRNINSKYGGREYPPLSAEKYILECSPYPSVIVECGFLSNPIDEANLIDPQYQALLAQCIFQGIAIFACKR